MIALHSFPLRSDASCRLESPEVFDPSLFHQPDNHWHEACKMRYQGPMIKNAEVLELLLGG